MSACSSSSDHLTCGWKRKSMHCWIRIGTPLVLSVRSSSLGFDCRRGDPGAEATAQRGVDCGPTVNRNHVWLKGSAWSARFLSAVGGGVMANDNEAKRLADWKTAAEKYCDLLDDMVKELRGKSDTVPATSNLKGLRTKRDR